MAAPLGRGELALGGLAIALVVVGASVLSATGHQPAAAVVAGVGVGATTFSFLLLAVLRTLPPLREAITEEKVAEGLACLSRLDRAVWGPRVERRLRNQDSTIWTHVPKDGVAASTLDFVSRCWYLPLNAFLVGLVLVSVRTGEGVVTGVGWVLIVAGLSAGGIGISCAFRASRERRAFRRSHQ
jgi:hypothetical protein